MNKYFTPDIKVFYDTLSKFETDYNSGRLWRRQLCHGVLL